MSTAISLKFKRSAIYLAAMLLATVLATGAASATTYYVGPNGNDAYSGISASRPFQSWWIANQHLHPGDTLAILPGTYSNLGIGTSGTASAPITYRAAEPANPPSIVSPGQYPAVWVNANYIRISNLTVTTGQQSLAAGLQIFGANHVEVDHVVAHDSGGGGLMAVYSDYISFVHDVAYNNSYAASNQTSGLAIGFGVNSDTRPGYHNLITDNVAYNNVDLVPVPGANYTTDGNGIIVDTMNAGSYVGGTLISNNISFNNGGSGIRLFRSNNIAVTNNTVVGNLQGATLSGLKGELSNVSGVGNLFRNNVVEATVSSAYAIVDAGNKGGGYDYNLTYGGMAAQIYKVASTTAWGSHNSFNKNPGFDPGTTFMLMAGSPALGSALGAIAPPYDIRGDARPSNHLNVDRGAYQQSP